MLYGSEYIIFGTILSRHKPYSTQRLVLLIIQHMLKILHRRHRHLVASCRDLFTIRNPDINSYIVTWYCYIHDISFFFWVNSKLIYSININFNTEVTTKYKWTATNSLKEKLQKKLKLEININKRSYYHRWKIARSVAVAGVVEKRF